MRQLEASGGPTRRAASPRAPSATRSPSCGRRRAMRSSQDGSRQPDGPVDTTEPVRGPPSGDAGMDRAGTRPVPRLGRRSRSGYRHGLAAIGMPAVRRWPSAGETSTWTLAARSTPQRRRRADEGRQGAPRRGADQDRPVPGRRPGRGHRRRAARLPDRPRRAGPERNWRGILHAPVLATVPSPASMSWIAL